MPVFAKPCHEAPVRILSSDNGDFVSFLFDIWLSTRLKMALLRDSLILELLEFVLCSSGGASCVVTHNADRNDRSLGEEGGRENQ